MFILKYFCFFKHINFDDNDYTEENYEQGRFPNFSFICDKEKTVTSDY